MAEARAATILPLADEALCGPPITDVPLSEPDSVALASVFAALGDPVRLRLLSMVAARGRTASSANSRTAVRSISCSSLRSKSMGRAVYET